jgi:hypothetical protein
MTITLYHGFPFRGTRCAWLVHELGFDPAQEDSPIKFHKMSLHAPPETIADYKQNVHPYGTIPALIIDEDGKQQTILESAAICLYLAQRFNNGMLPSAEESANYYNVSSNKQKKKKKTIALLAICYKQELNMNVHFCIGRCSGLCMLVPLLMLLWNLCTCN